VKMEKVPSPAIGVKRERVLSPAGGAAVKSSSAMKSQKVSSSVADSAGGVRKARSSLNAPLPVTVVDLSDIQLHGVDDDDLCLECYKPMSTMEHYKSVYQYCCHTMVYKKELLLFFQYLCKTLAVFNIFWLVTSRRNLTQMMTPVLAASL